MSNFVGAREPQEPAKLQDSDNGRKRAGLRQKSSVHQELKHSLQPDQK